MARIKRKGQAGSAKNYVTRSQAVRKLQVSLPDFRRLCIFKGIYPREPRSRKRASKSATPSTTFYYAKDIQYLLHEPLLEKFRAQKTLAKRISKALGRNEVGEAARFEKTHTPKIRLDHIIKERYPAFVDALRDLDDALCTLYLFANLPTVDGVPPKLTRRCQRLTLEFEHYLIQTHSLRKSFLSIKGIYYQATIHGQDILWLVPYKFVQRTAPDVDFRIMGTFVEFYATLLGFVNFRLFTSIGLVYPPTLNAKSQDDGAELSAFEVVRQGQQESADEQLTNDLAITAQAQEAADLLDTQGVGEETEEVAAVEEQRGALDSFVALDPSADDLPQPARSADAQVSGKLFDRLTIFLSRETPRAALEFIVRAFGCKRVAWDATLGAGTYCNESDSRITHQIIDRPDLPPVEDDEALSDDDREAMKAVRERNARVPGRIYVQPQWIWDSINAGQLQRSDLYAPGATLPPHLSPWVKPRKGDYDPTLPLDAQETELERETTRIQSTAAVEEEEEEEDDEEEEDSDGGMDVEFGDEDDEQEDTVTTGNGFGGFSEDDEQDEASIAARAHQTELEAENLGKRIPQQHDSKAAKLAKVTQKHSLIQKNADEDLERRKMMLSRRKRKMYDKMVYSNERRDEKAEKLRDKRRKIEAAR